MIILLALAGSPRSFAQLENEFDAVKKENSRLLTHCLNYKDRSRGERNLGNQIRTSLNAFISRREETEAQDKNKLFGVGVSHVDVDTKKAVLIFRRESGLAAASSSNRLLRTEQRTVIEKYVSKWSGQNKKYQDMKFLVRFDDECQTPHLKSWK